MIIIINHLEDLIKTNKDIWNLLKAALNFKMYYLIAAASNLPFNYIKIFKNLLCYRLTDKTLAYKLTEERIPLTLDKYQFIYEESFYNPIFSFAILNNLQKKFYILFKTQKNDCFL